MNRKIAFLFAFITLLAMSSVAWEYDGVYTAAAGEKKLHDFGKGGRVDELFLRLENHSNVGFQIEVVEAMGVIICVPTIDGKTTMMSNESGDKEPLVFMDSNGFMLVKSSVAKVMFSEKAKDMGENDQLLIENDYDGGMTHSVLTLVGDEYHVGYRW